MWLPTRTPQPETTVQRFIKWRNRNAALPHFTVEYAPFVAVAAPTLVRKSNQNTNPVVA
jgi:hypothetical protein